MNATPRPRTLTTATLFSALLLLPTATAHAAGPIASVGVGGSTANTSYAMNGIAKLPLSVTIDTALGDLTLGCNSGAPTGVVKGGTSGLGSTTNAPFEFTDLDLDCESPIGGSTTMTVTCNLDAVFADTVTSGTDTAVKGKLHVTDRVTGANCIKVQTMGSCTFYIGGNTDITFNETTKTVSGVTYQDLVISGNGLQVKGPVSFGCLGMVANGNAITLNATFDLKNTGGLVNFTD